MVHEKRSDMTNLYPKFIKSKAFCALFETDQKRPAFLPCF